jgi:cation:H+ antiporter
MLGDIAEVFAGLILLIWGADRFVHGAAATARNLGVAPLMIGLTIVSFATSAPEILVSVVAAGQGKAGLAIGNAIGSNIANIGLVLGTVALFRPIELKSATLRREMPALLAVSLLTVALFLDSYLARIDGFVLLTGLVIVIIWLVRLGIRSSSTDPLQTDFEAEIPTGTSMKWAITWLVVGLVALLFGADFLVDGAIAIARAIGVSEMVIGITLVALNIFNLLAVIGIAAAIQPSAMPPSVLSLHLFVMVAFTLVLFAMTYEYDGRGVITRYEGFALVSAFLAYDTYVVLQNVRIEF